MPSSTTSGHWPSRERSGIEPGKATPTFAWQKLVIDEGRYGNAVRQATEAVHIGEETGNARIVSSGNETLALARLATEDLPGARLRRLRHAPTFCSSHSVLALLGLIALRQGDRVAAAEAFSAAIAHSDVILGRYEQNYDALDAKGLALAGLAVLEGSQGAAEAIVAFRAARAITSAPGVVARVKRLLDFLSPADVANILGGVHDAAASRDVP